MLAFDLETVADESVIPWLPPCEAPGNYKDQAKIDAYVAEAIVARNAKLALDPDCCRIVALGYTAECDDVVVLLAPNVDAERDALEAFWREWSRLQANPVGYNCVGFDLPVLVQRSRILGVSAPRLTLRKYGSPDCIDLMLDLSHGGLTSYKSLGFWCKRLGLDVPADPTTGADIAGLVAAGRWADVEAHTRADVAKTLTLARRLNPGVR